MKNINIIDFHLSGLEKKLKWFILIFLVVLSIGVTIGLVYVCNTTRLNSIGIVEHYAGSKTVEFDIPEKYPKSIESMLLTTHTHIISFAMIFLLLGGLFNFNSIIKGNWKYFLMIEPLLATILTFGSLWGIRYIHTNFVFLTILSGTLMYISFYTMIVILLYDLLKK